MRAVTKMTIAKQVSEVTMDYSKWGQKLRLAPPAASVVVESTELS